MSFTKITNTELNSRGATTLPNQPTISAANLKKEFDAPAKEVVAPKFNNLVDELEAVESASSLGAVAPTGRTGATVQAVINSVSGDLATLEGSVAQAIEDDHTHDNKDLLDTYDQTNADITSAVTNSHTHSNKSLLDTYTQTEANLADAVSKKHEHSNKSLLDTYTQTEANLADAVSKKHAHTNLALLETYTQTESDLAQAVTDDHTHSNKTVIDDLSDDGSGNLLYDGNPVGGGTVNDAYKSIKVGSTTMSASGEDTFEIEAGSNVTLTAGTKKVTIAASGGTPDAYKNIVSAGQTFAASGADTFKINAGSNVTITALSSPDKGIQISAAGGGQSTGDMLMSDYDSSGTVKTAGGIPAYVTAQIGALDVSDSAESGKYVSAVSEADGKITVTRASLPSIPTVVNTYSSTGTDAISGTGVAAALGTLDGTVSGSAGAGNTLTAFSQTDGKVSATFGAISITKSQISDFPTIPTVNNATLTIQKNGTNVQTFTANASSDVTANIATDDWVATASVSSGAFSVTVDDTQGYAYKPYFVIDGNSTNLNPSYEISSITGAGTASCTIAYTTDADNGTNNVKIRRIK